jgi:hypothetical protein
VVKLLVSTPGARDTIKQQLDLPADGVNETGYALFAGQKPTPADGHCDESK